MKETAYRDRDYAFGQVMLTLRTRIGLTQAALADYLGVSRRAVGDWEAGGSYPRVENLKLLVALAIEHRAFAAGREVVEVRALWQAAGQKVLLDETWLAALLQGTPAAAGPVPPAPGGAGRAQSEVAPRLDWYDAPVATTFYGRARELALLSGWVVEERCRVVSVVGLGGIGKSALSVTLMRQVAPQFAVVIWRSLHDAPGPEALLDDLLQALGSRPPVHASGGFDSRLSLLLACLRGRRVLLVLDNLETLLARGEAAGRMHTGYEGYARLLCRVAETEHQGCLLVTSREKPADLVPLEGNRSPVRAFRLTGLETDACGALLAESEISGSAAECTQLIQAYGGNPLALKIVARAIADLFAGQVAPFLAQGEVVFGGVRDLLDEQVDRLSELEQRLLLWLGRQAAPSTLEALLAAQTAPVPRARLLEAVEGLRRRSLVEPGPAQGSFTLQPLVRKYAAARLVVAAGDDSREGRPARLVEGRLVLAQAREHLRQT